MTIAIYFHGAPSPPQECQRFTQEAQTLGVRLVCINRFDELSPTHGTHHHV